MKPSGSVVYKLVGSNRQENIDTLYILPFVILRKDLQKISTSQNLLLYQRVGIGLKGPSCFQQRENQLHSTECWDHHRGTASLITGFYCFNQSIEFEEILHSAFRKGKRKELLDSSLVLSYLPSRE